MTVNNSQIKSVKSSQKIAGLKIKEEKTTQSRPKSVRGNEHPKKNSRTVHKKDTKNSLFSPARLNQSKDLKISSESSALG